jgi:hypothetical protein
MAFFFNKSPTLNERLADERKRIKIAMALLAPGSKRNRLSEKLRQLDIAAQINEWLSSPGLRAPT